MSDLQLGITCFERPGRHNTASTVRLAGERARALGIGHLVVASNTGETATAAAEAVGGAALVVCVTHQVGFAGPGVDELGADGRAKLKGAGLEVLTTTHLMAGIDRALRLSSGGLYPGEIVAGSLRMLGQGLKVCVEICSMALDAGLIPYGREVMAIGGSGRGADAAAVILPAHGHAIFETEVREVVCMPRRKK